MLEAEGCDEGNTRCTFVQMLTVGIASSFGAKDAKKQAPTRYGNARTRNNLMISKAAYANGGPQV
ncbi:MAG: hypothetical protein M1821_007528 [Bathelium mastoideum]|nr:MAG: hypothetical protein M1821_007528 [Bathelium mastoideum]